MSACSRKKATFSFPIRISPFQNAGCHHPSKQGFSATVPASHVSNVKHLFSGAQLRTEGRYDLPWRSVSKKAVNDICQNLIIGLLTKPGGIRKKVNAMGSIW